MNAVGIDVSKEKALPLSKDLVMWSLCHPAISLTPSQP